MTFDPPAPKSVVFVGVIGGRTGPARRVRVEVPYGGEAYVFALSRDWLTPEIPDGVSSAQAGTDVPSAGDELDQAGKGSS